MISCGIQNSTQHGDRFKTNMWPLSSHQRLRLIEAWIGDSVFGNLGVESYIF